LFKALGLWAQIQPHAAPILEVQVSDKGHAGKVSYPAVGNESPLGYVAANPVLGEALNSVASAANLTVFAPAQVEKLVPVVNGAELILAPLQKLKANLVIIADGAESSLGAGLGIAVDVHDYQQHAVITNLAFEKHHQGRAFERFTSEGPMALLPLPKENGEARGALVWTRPGASLEASMSCSDAEFIAQVQKRFGYQLGKITRVAKRYSYPLRLCVSKEQVRSNIVLLGNAAHSLHPVAGQGFNLALRDAMQLVDVLVAAKTAGKHCGDMAVLQSYMDAQRLDQGLTTALSHSFNGLFSNDKFGFQALRNIGLISLELIPGLNHRFFGQMMGRSMPQVQLDFMRGAKIGAKTGAKRTTRRM